SRSLNVTLPSNTCALSVVPSVTTPSRMRSLEIVPPTRPPNSGQPNVRHSCLTSIGSSVASTMNATLGNPALRIRKLCSASAPSSSGMRVGCSSLTCLALLLNCSSLAPSASPSSDPPLQRSTESSLFCCGSARQCTAPPNDCNATVRAPASK